VIEHNGGQHEQARQSKAKRARLTGAAYRFETPGGWAIGAAKRLARVRAYQAAVRRVIETWTWRGFLCGERDGIICTGETLQGCVKLTFAKGQRSADPKRIFNRASQAPRGARSISTQGQDFHETALKAIVRGRRPR